MYAAKYSPKEPLMGDKTHRKGGQNAQIWHFLMFRARFRGWSFLHFPNSIQVLIKGVLVFFDIFGRSHSKNSYKLLSEIPHIADTHLESSLTDIHILCQHQHSSSSEPDRPDKSIQPLPGDRLDLLVEPGMAHTHGLGEFLHCKFFIINIFLNYCYTLSKEI